MNRTSRLLFVNPGSDVYGSDLQLLESVKALVHEDTVVTVAVPSDGPLIAMLEAVGARVTRINFPVLRRTDRHPRALVALIRQVLTSLPAAAALVRRADILYVNTCTIPWWLFVAKVLRTPSICHVHEAESHEGLMGRIALYWPLLLADRIVFIGEASRRAGMTAVRALARKAHVIRNGVPFPSLEPAEGRWEEPVELGVVARLSPRKGTMDALEATAALRSDGIDVKLHLFGSVFEGYEWYESELRQRAKQPDLSGSVHFHGYVRPVWGSIAAMDIILATSHIEPYGNSIVEAQYSLRPVVASDAEGHTESIQDGRTGLLYPVGDVESMSRQIRRLIDDVPFARELARQALIDARERNNPEIYARAISDVVREVAAREN